VVHFYEDEVALIDVVGTFLRAGLDLGDRLVVIATPSHRDAFVDSLHDRDVGRAIASGQLLLLDAQETLERVMVEGRPDPIRFHRTLGEMLARAADGGKDVRVRAYGEMVDLLWRNGQQTAALELEELWNEARTRHAFALLCTYVMANFYKGSDAGGFVDVCRAHSHVLPAGSGAKLDGVVVAPELALELSRLRERLRPAELELEQRRGIERALREASVEQRRTSQEELLTSEARFHHLVDAVTDYAIFMLDSRGHIATWNPGAKKAKGYEAHEIIGQHFSIFYTAEDRRAGKPNRILEAVRRDGRFEEEGWRVRKDGSRFWANVVITALRDPKGALTGFAKVTRDLTSRREGEQREEMLAREQLARSVSDDERRRLLSLLQQVPAIVSFLRGPDLLFEFVHPKATIALGGRNIKGQPFLVAMPEHCDEPAYARLRGVFDTGEPFEQHEAHAWFDMGDGQAERFWNSVYLPVRNASGAVEGVMTFDLDVTESACSPRGGAREQRKRRISRDDEP
jgi:PAS domain S-box-containing protein